jgi:hypothetical protein
MLAHQNLKVIEDSPTRGRRMRSLLDQRQPGEITTLVDKQIEDEEMDACCFRAVILEQIEI